ncbi:UbiA family prenyltransferase [Streptantibioticus silvisoli]|uniref:UbiA family prenyltransferase n=1 Tax=Streptantibioticus silvisoli TaxID=2705255 RepID=A0ABT6VX29_9ACTN|nr:UbiA family prenyltransferase [Streptantibioticus silvisoli]MDI5963044.1 UbiA family prenyltransferase [Streptantibioticus silvisoli]
MSSDRAALAPATAPPRRAFVLLGAAHPAPALLVAAVVTALAVSCGRAPFGCLAVGTATLAGQLSIGWCNDRVDLARDRAAGRRDKPLARGELAPRTVATAALVALLACVPLSLAAGLAAGAAHLTGVAAGWAYNLRLKRTPLSWLPYAVAFGLLPAFVTLGLPSHPWPPAWATAAGALLGLGAHTANVLPDIDADLAAGVRGLPQRMGARWSRAVTGCSLATASAVLLLGPPGSPGPAALTALALTVALSAGAAVLPGTDGRLPFLAVLAVAAIDVILLVGHGAVLAP